MAFEVISVKRLLVNRFTITLAVLVVAAAAFQGYAAANNEGHVHGTVVDSNGDPVANATVVLEPETIAGVPDRREATTDKNGYFEFYDASLLEFRIAARHPDAGESERERHHLYFRGQNMEVTLVVD